MSDYTTLKEPEAMIAWAAGRITGLAVSTRYEMDEELRDELRQIAFLLEGNN